MEGKKTKVESDTQPRPCNWIVVARLLRRKGVDYNEAAKCFVFKESIDDEMFKRRLFDAFRRYVSDEKLPQHAHHFAGMHLGLLPPGGIEFDTRLFKTLFLQHIIENQKNKFTPGFKPTKINVDSINAVIPKLIEFHLNLHPDFKGGIIYTETMEKSFRTRWFIDAVSGTFKVQKPVKLGHAWEFTKYAKDKGYDKEQKSEAASGVLNSTVPSIASALDQVENNLSTLKQNLKDLVMLMQACNEEGRQAIVDVLSDGTILVNSVLADLFLRNIDSVLTELFRRKGSENKRRKR
jgi:hypothetical protein